MAHRLALVALPLVMVPLLTAGCAGRPDPFARNVSVAGREVAHLEVRNRNTEDVVVYATRGSIRYRLGTVPGLADESFVVNAAVVDDGLTLLLAAAPVGSNRSYQTPPLALSPGDRVVWRLLTPMEMSDVSIRQRQR